MASPVVHPAGANLGQRPVDKAGNKAGIEASAGVNGSKRAAKQSGTRSKSTKSVPSNATNKKVGDPKEQPAERKEVIDLTVESKAGATQRMMDMVDVATWKGNLDDMDMDWELLVGNLTEGDDGLRQMFMEYGRLCSVEKTQKLLCCSLKGLHASSLQDLFNDHCGFVDEEVKPEWRPPTQKLSSANKIEFIEPSDGFRQAAMEVYQVLHVFIISCQFNHVAPVRWNWEHSLVSKLGRPDHATKQFALLVCLVLSAATVDKSCIEATANLFAAGYLDPYKLSVADIKTIQGLIHRCGIQKVKSRFLINMANTVLYQYNGVPPTNLPALMKLSGVARKTAVLFLSEGCGMLEGIGSDTHVLNVTDALELIGRAERGPRITPEHAEASLREWVEPTLCRDVNRTMGSFAQLFTQDLATIHTPEQVRLSNAVVQAVRENTSKPLHVELFWFALKRVRQHYRTLAAQNNSNAISV